MLSRLLLAIGVVLLGSSVVILLAMGVGAVSAAQYGPLIPGAGVTPMPTPGPSGGLP